MAILELKWGADIDTIAGKRRKLGLTVCYEKFTEGTELYLQIDLWKWSISLGKILM